jgi:hypothetical protein
MQRQFAPTLWSPCSGIATLWFHMTLRHAPRLCGRGESELLHLCQIPGVVLHSSINRSKIDKELVAGSNPDEVIEFFQLT